MLGDRDAVEEARGQLKSDSVKEDLRCILRCL